MSAAAPSRNRNRRSDLIGCCWAGLLLLLAGDQAQAWVLELPSDLDLTGPRITLGDLTIGTIPEEAAAIVLVDQGRPGRTYTLTRQKILRMLTSRHLSRDVVLRGARTCLVTLVGRTVERDDLASALLAALRAWLPDIDPAAPAPQLAVLGELPSVADDEGWRLELVNPHRLIAGRNLVAVRIGTDASATRFTAMIDCRLFGEVARARRNLARDEIAGADLFSWEWSSLAELESGVVSGRENVVGMSMARSVTAGDLLRTPDLRRTPLVRRGEPVELILGRGSVEVTMRGTARQDGAAGQFISVKNETNGRLVTAKVVGPGRVSWRN